MALFLAESRMWQILLLSICSASLKYVLAEDLQYAQPAGQINIPPSIRAPLAYSQAPLNYPTENLDEKTIEVPFTYNKENTQFKGSQIESDCPQLKILENILVLLKRLLSQGDNTYIQQPEKRLQILQSLNEYLVKYGPRADGIENQQKLKNLIARTGNPILVENDTPQNFNDVNKKNLIEANLIFKYDIPSISNVGCDEALKTLIDTVKNAYLQMIKYCGQSKNCNLNSDPLSIQQKDKSNALHSIFTLDQTKIAPSNPNLPNIYGIGSSTNTLVNSNNQVQNQRSLYDYLKQPQSDLNNNQYLNLLNSGAVQTQNNQEKSVQAYSNTNLNREISQTSVQQSDKSNIFNSLMGVNQPIPTPVQVTPKNLYPWNIAKVDSPINNIVKTPLNQEDISQRLFNSNMNYNLHPQSYIDRNNVVSKSILSSGIIQTLKNQAEKVENKRYGMWTMGNHETMGSGGYNPIPLFQSQNVERYVPLNYNSDNNRKLYTVSQLVNDKRASIAALNQNNQNIKEQIQHNGESNPGYEINNFPSYATPNQNMRLVNPTFYSSVNTKQFPYLSSLNLNQQNSLNYNSKQADATVQGNFGVNLYAPTNLLDYSKHDIYSNLLFDSNRLASANNLDKLNSVTDNEEIVELTYKFNRPQSVTYSPYYYVKFRMPYRDFVSKVTELIKNPYIRSNPLKLHQELLSVSNLTETPSNLKGVQIDDLHKIILNNDGILINAEVIGAKDTTNDYLKLIQNLNAKLKTNDILNLVEKDKTNTKATTSLDAGNSLLRPEWNTPVLSYSQKLNPQYVDPRRLLASGPYYASKPIHMTFLPANYGSGVVFNPEVPLNVKARFNYLTSI